MKIPRQTPRPPAIAPPSGDKGLRRKPAPIPINARINVPESCDNFQVNFYDYLGTLRK